MISEYQTKFLSFIIAILQLGCVSASGGALISNPEPSMVKWERADSSVFDPHPPGGLEGSYAHHYTTNACFSRWFGCTSKVENYT